MERIRRQIAPISIGVFVAVVVAAIIDGREFLRVRSISLAYGHDYRDSLVVFLLVVAATFVFAAVGLAAVSASDSADRKALIGMAALLLSLFASLPVYWYTYRDAPEGWHINIAEEHRWAQPAGVAAALFSYGLWQRVARRRYGARSVSSTPTA